jgi:glycosyltransferase involved in cell wall biosynthesis
MRNAATRSSRLRVLHLSTELPHPRGVSGGAVRQFHLDAQLARLGHKVTVIAPVSVFQQKDLQPIAALANVGIRLIATPRRSPREREALRAFARRPALLLRAPMLPLHGLQTEMLAIDMEPAIRREIAQDIDVVVIDHDFAVRLADVVQPSTPKVITLHNDTPSYYRARASVEKGLMRQASRWQAAMSDRYITPCLNRFDLLIAVSESDASLISKRTRVPVEVVPNGTDAGTTAFSGWASEPTILFTGSMNHPPNRDGILWFHKEIWPKIVAMIPEARLLIVGRHPQQEIVQLANVDPQVAVTGEVPDMRPYYEQASVAIAPLRSGGGTRLKILDALAAVRPIVTTTVGCEGLDVIDGVHVLVADDTDNFAERTVQLLRDRDLNRRIATQGRAFVEQRYDWRTLGAKYAQLLTDVVSHRAS